MITDIPNASDFYFAGIELLDFSWETTLNLLFEYKNLTEATGLTDEDWEKTYWQSAARSLSISMATIQQAVELIIKGRICEISPFLLLVDPPKQWPTPVVGESLSFSKFRTLDAHDLIKVNNLFSSTVFSSAFTEKFHKLRNIRNKFVHTVTGQPTNDAINVVITLLFFFRELFPSENWAKTRFTSLSQSPFFRVTNDSYSINNVLEEIHYVYEILSGQDVKLYFGVNKNNRLYHCPKCRLSAESDYDEVPRIADFHQEDGNRLFCPICADYFTVEYKNCDEDGCDGNLFYPEFKMCLTCGNH